MEQFAVTALLLTALVLPIVLFWQLRSRSRLHGLMAAAIAVAAGWALNVAWAYVSQGVPTNDPAQGDTLSIAVYFGWICPSILTVLTWLVWRFKARRAA
ncbi:hypothetical protein [Lysobacter solisilvae (ex Woo and Kim 2020)]|uniref:Uncharacterized protein n=1 Tax=Agrilutibacter terrestris TaxID=2865112 RepID=A0A7H0FYH4_9GAMM|nr:hypothetical protein [Lysobacter terrestris]QNP41090.1 hypothetical protein H8B22_02355 [Lysobacter terrestris]